MTAANRSVIDRAIKCLDSSTIEQSAINRSVASSNLACSTITDHWCSGLTCFPVTEEITSSNLVWSAILLGAYSVDSSGADCKSVV